MTASTLLRQQSSNRQHERHANHEETVYWCNQWRLLSGQAIEEAERLTFLATKVNELLAELHEPNGLTPRRDARRSEKLLAEARELLERALHPR